MDATILQAAELCQLIESDDSPLWLIRAGTIPRGVAHWFLPPPNGKPLCAFGLFGNYSVQNTPRANELLRDALRHETVQCACETAGWHGLQQESGGDFCTVERLHEKLPRVASVFLNAPQTLSKCIGESSSIDAAIRVWLSSSPARCVRLPHLDVFDDPALRVAQVVTSLQRGGAERIALELARELPRCGVRPLLFALGSPMRAAFATPEENVEFPPGRNRAEHVRSFAARAVALGCDAVHAHLLSADDMAHRRGKRTADRGDCSQCQTGLVRRFRLPARTAGAPPASYVSRRVLARCRARFASARISARRCERFGMESMPASTNARCKTRNAPEVCAINSSLLPADFVLLSLANPRPQKRLERLPAVLTALRVELNARGIFRDAKWIVAGEASRASEDAVRCESALRAEVQRLNLGDAVRFVGAAENVAALLNASDALVSVSAWEGLSLAHLEALAAGFRWLRRTRAGRRRSRLKIRG